MVKVKIKATVITSQYGTLSAGDMLTTNEVFAKHLVDECAAAEYVTQQEKPASNESGAQAERKRSASLLEKAKRLFK